jgi:hypothetical protein
MSDQFDKTGGQAFPAQKFAQSGDMAVATPTPGMSLRDYFAASALQGMCAAMRHEDIELVAQGTLGGKHKSIAAYVFADAMITQRKQ